MRSSRVINKMSNRKTAPHPITTEEGIRPRGGVPGEKRTTITTTTTAAAAATRITAVVNISSSSSSSSNKRRWQRKRWKQ